MDAEEIVNDYLDQWFDVVDKGHLVDLFINDIMPDEVTDF